MLLGVNPESKGIKIQEALEELVLSRCRTPEVLLTDNRNEFFNRSLRGCAKQYSHCHATTPLHHPQTNPVVRENRVLKSMIILFLEADHRARNSHLAEF